VTGPQSIVDALTERDISVYAPLSGLIVGKHTVTLQATAAGTDLAGSSIEIPENQAEVTIMARNPTVTPTAG
jgi:hypothetical protein